MKRRILSFFLALLTLLSLFPTAAFAADTPEAALGEVNIYNGEYELGYLSINGTVRKQIYTYFLYEGNDGQQKEAPAYCVNPNTKRASSTWPRKSPATPRWSASSPTAIPTAPWGS